MKSLDEIEKKKIENLYKDVFVKIIFYYNLTSDLQMNDFFYVKKYDEIFYHFANKFTELIDSIDGIFYITNHYVINKNIINLYLNDKIMLNNENKDVFFLPIKYFHQGFLNFAHENEDNVQNYSYDTLINIDDIYDSFNKKHNLILFIENILDKDLLYSKINNIFNKDRCVIITTINEPTETIIKQVNNQDYDVIIVGDVKTSNETYTNLKCIFLDIKSQEMLFTQLSTSIPYNHYCRKNLGYIYAIKKGYKIIYETDDDNIPYENFDNILDFKNSVFIKELSSVWINVFKYFTKNKKVWMRGFPISLINNEPKFYVENTNIIPSVINGLVDNDPDVDALFRIIHGNQKDIIWEKNKKIVISNENICVFNSQNTFWIDYEIFITMLIPTTVSFRYCDILRGIITNIILKYTNKFMSYTSSNVYQLRNEHNLIDDFKSEVEMYINNEEISSYIENNIEKGLDIKIIIIKIYENLLEHKIIKKIDLQILMEWLRYFTK